MEQQQLCLPRRPANSTCTSEKQQLQGFRCNLGGQGHLRCHASHRAAHRRAATVNPIPNVLFLVFTEKSGCQMWLCAADAAAACGPAFSTKGTWRARGQGPPCSCAGSERAGRIHGDCTCVCSHKHRRPHGVALSEAPSLVL